MRRQDDFSERSHPRVETPVITVDLDRGIVWRWRRRNAERRVARLLRPRNRRALAQRLRCAAVGATRGGAAVRAELLDIADLLERAHDPDPASVEELGELLASRASPLNDPDAHISELHAALYYVRAGLITPPSFRRPAITRQPTAGHGMNHIRTSHPYADHSGVHADPPPAQTTDRSGLVRCRRERRAERKRSRLVSPRNRRILARQLRLTARRATDRDAIRRRHDVLLHYRAAAVRTDLLEIAALLEHTPDPCPDSVAALSTLLANGCDSPLYNVNIHFCELQATLDYVRSGL